MIVKMKLMKSRLSMRVSGRIIDGRIAGSTPDVKHYRYSEDRDDKAMTAAALSL
jgi:hypothetical protein